LFAAELICILTSQNASFVESAIRPTYNAPNAMFNHVGNVTQMPDPKSKLQRRRQFLKNLDAFSRKPSLEQLEPRIVLNSSFNTAIDMGKLIVWKDGTPDKTVEIGKLDYGNGNILTLPDATYYVTHDQYGTWKSGLIDKAPIKIDSYGSGTITANANGELEFSDVSAYVRNKQNWDLLFKGDVTFKDKQRYSTQLADKTASSANDLQLTGMELEISKLGVISSPSGNHIARFQGDAIPGGLLANANQSLIEWATSAALEKIAIENDKYLESDGTRGLRTSSQITWSPKLNKGQTSDPLEFNLTSGTSIIIEKPKISYDQTLQELVIGGKYKFKAKASSTIGKLIPQATGDFSGKGDGIVISPKGLSLRGKIELEAKIKGNDAKLSLSIKEDEWAIDLALKIDKVAEFSGGVGVTFQNDDVTFKSANLGIALSKPVPVPGVPGVFFDSGKLAAKNLENGLGKGEYNLEAVFNIGPKVEYELSNTEKNVLDLLFDDGSSNYNLPDKIGFKLAEVKFNGALDLEKNQVKLDLVKNIMKLSWEQGDNNYALLGQRYDGEAWVQWAPWVVGGSLDVDQFAYVNEDGKVSSVFQDRFGFQFNVDTEYASHVSNVEVKKTTTVQGSVEKKIPLSEILSLTDNKVITGAIKALANSLGTSDLSAIVGGTVEYTKQRSINSWSGDPEPWEYSSKIKLGVSVGRFTVVIEVNASGENLDNVEFEADWYTTSKNTIKPVKFGEGSNATSNVFDFVQDHDAIIFSVQFESNVPVPPYKPTVTLTEHGSNVKKTLNISYDKGEDFQGSTSHPFGHVYTFRVDADSANSVNFENTTIVISSPGTAPSISNLEYRAFPTYFPKKITADYHFVGLDNQTGIMTFDYAICIDPSSQNSPAPDHDDFFSLSADINGTEIPGERVLPTPTLTMTENNCPVSVSNVGRVEFNLKDTDLTGLNNVELLMTDQQGLNPSPWLERYGPKSLPVPTLASPNDPHVNIENIQRAPRFNNSHLDSLADDDGAIDLVHPSSLGVHRFEIFAYDPDIEHQNVTFQLINASPNVTIDYDSGTSLDPMPWNGSAYLDVMVDPTQFGPYQEEFTVEATRNGLTSEETFRVHITPPVNQDYIIESIGKALSSLGTTLTGMSGNLTTWLKPHFHLPHVNPVQQGLAQLAPYVQSNLFENPVIVLPAIGTNQSQRVFKGERVIIQLDDNRPEILTLPNGAKNIVDAFNEALFANPSLGTRIMASTYVDPATNTVVDDAVKLTPIADFTVKSILYTPYVHVVDELLLNPHDFTGGSLPSWESITFEAGNAMVTLPREDIADSFKALSGPPDERLVRAINQLLVDNLGSDALMLLRLEAGEFLFSALQTTYTTANQQPKVTFKDTDSNTRVELPHPHPMPAADVLGDAAFSKYTFEFDSVSELNTLLGNVGFVGCHPQLNTNTNTNPVVIHKIDPDSPENHSIEFCIDALSAGIDTDFYSRFNHPYISTINTDIGDIDLAGEIDVQFWADMDLKLGFGVDLTRGGREMPLHDATLLHDLHRQEGVRIDATRVGEHGGYSNYRHSLASDGFFLELVVNGNFGDRTVLVNLEGEEFYAMASNEFVLDVLNEELTAQLAGTGYEFHLWFDLISDDGLLTLALTNDNWFVNSLQITDVGFGAIDVWGPNDAKREDAIAVDDPRDPTLVIKEPDLVITLLPIAGGSTEEIEVVLDGVVTLGDVRDRIQNALATNVSDDDGTPLPILKEDFEVTIDEFGGLQFYSRTPFEISEWTPHSGIGPFDPTLGESVDLNSTASRLGVIGTGKMLKHGTFYLRGEALDRRTWNERIYFTEPRWQLQTRLEATGEVYAGSVGIGGDLVLDAALETDLTVSFTDPGTEEDDQRIYISEIQNSSLDDYGVAVDAAVYLHSTTDPVVYTGSNSGFSFSNNDSWAAGQSWNPAQLMGQIDAFGSCLNFLIEVVSKNPDEVASTSARPWESGYFQVQTDGTLEFGKIDVDQVVLAATNTIQTVVTNTQNNPNAAGFDWLNKQVDPNTTVGDKILQVNSSLQQFAYPLDPTDVASANQSFKSAVANLPDNITWLREYNNSIVPGDFDFNYEARTRLNWLAEQIDFALTLSTPQRQLSRLVTLTQHLSNLSTWELGSLNGPGPIDTSWKFKERGKSALNEVAFSTNPTANQTPNILFLLQELNIAVKQLLDSVPSLNRLPQRVANEFETAICEGLYDPALCQAANPIDVQLKWAHSTQSVSPVAMPNCAQQADYDSLVLGIGIDPEWSLVEGTSAPSISLLDYGPLQASVEGTNAFMLDGAIQLSAGVTIDSNGDFIPTMVTHDRGVINPTSIQVEANLITDNQADLTFNQLKALKGAVRLGVFEPTVTATTISTGSPSLISLNPPIAEGKRNSEFVFIYVHDSGTEYKGKGDENQNAVESSIAVDTDEYVITSSGQIEFLHESYNGKQAIVFYPGESAKSLEPIDVTWQNSGSGQIGDTFQLNEKPLGGEYGKIHLKDKVTGTVIPSASYKIQMGNQSAFEVEALVDLSSHTLEYFLITEPPTVRKTETFQSASDIKIDDMWFGSNRMLGTPFETEVFGGSGGNRFQIAPTDYHFEWSDINKTYEFKPDPSLIAGPFEVSYVTNESFQDGKGGAAAYLDLAARGNSSNTINAFGGTKFSDLSFNDDLNYRISGMGVGSADVHLFSQLGTDAIAASAIAGKFHHTNADNWKSPSATNALVDYRADVNPHFWDDLIANADVNLKTIVQAFEGFLLLLEKGVRDHILGKYPFLPNDKIADAVDFIEDFRQDFVTPLKDRLCTVGGQGVELIAGEMAAWIYSALGPGIENGSPPPSGFTSIFADMLTNAGGDSTWFVEPGQSLNFIRLDQFKVASSDRTSSDLAGVPTLKERYTSPDPLVGILADISNGQSVYKQLGDDWIEIKVDAADPYAFFKAIVPIIIGEKLEIFEIGDIGTLHDVVSQNNNSATKAQIGNIPLGTIIDIPVSPITALKSLPKIQVSGQADIDLKIDLEFDLGFGTEKDQGTYVIVNDESQPAHQGKEIEVELTGSLDPNDYFQLDLWSLGFHAQNVDTYLSGSGFIDIGDKMIDTSSEGQNKLTFSEMADNKLDDYLCVGGQVDAKLEIDLSLGHNTNPNIPSLSQRLAARYLKNFDTCPAPPAKLTVSNPNSNSQPDEIAELGLYDIRLDLGKFVTKSIGPIIKEVDKVLDPVKPIVDLLLTEVPGISEASQIAGEAPVILLDYLFKSDPDKAAKARKFVGIVQQLQEVVDLLASYPPGGNMSINFGDVVFGKKVVNGPNPAGYDIDPFEDEIPEDDTTLQQIYDQTGGQSATDVDAQTKTNSTFQAGFQKLNADPGPFGLGGLGIEFHLLEQPFNIVKLLMGRQADIISWDIPRFDVSATFSKDFPILPFPPVELGIGAEFGAFADFSVGLDSRFLQTGNFLDGFYFGDRENVFNGTDIAEMGLTIGGELRAELEMLIAAAGVGGRLEANINADWRDSNNDGKLHLDELKRIVESDGMACLFDLTGALEASIFLYVDYWAQKSNRKSKIVADRIIPFDLVTCPPQKLAHVSEVGEVVFDNPSDESLISGDDWLVIHAGEFAHQRGGNESDSHEAFEIAYDGNLDEITLTNLVSNKSEIYADAGALNKIYFSGGYGHDSLRITGDWSSWGAGKDILFRGGVGDDSLEFEAGSNYDYSLGVIAIGNAGDDRFKQIENLFIPDKSTIPARRVWLGGSGDDSIELLDDLFHMIDSGSGADSIEVGPSSPPSGNVPFGLALIETGSGDDEIKVSHNNSQIHSGTGKDLITYGNGYNVIFAGPGDDIIEPRLVAHTSRESRIFGGTGNDQITGNNAGNLLSGGPGIDVIIGNAGNDYLIGGDGNDYLIGGQGEDRIWAGFGNDIVIGNELGNVGDSSTTLGNWLSGGPDNDLLCGSNGSDELIGGSDLSHLQFRRPMQEIIDYQGSKNSDLFSTTNLGVRKDLFDKNDQWESYFETLIIPNLSADFASAPVQSTYEFEKPLCHATNPPLPLEPPVIADLDMPSPAENVLTGTVFQDQDGNLVVSDGDSLKSEITIGLFDQQGELLEESVTDEAGAYEFTTVGLGNYSLKLMPSTTLVYDTVIPQLGEHTLQITEGESYHGLDFAIQPGGHTITGYKLETGRDGVISNWPIHLYDEARNHLQTTYTSDDDSSMGMYSFVGLPSGTYFIAEQQRQDWVQSGPELSDNTGSSVTIIHDDEYTLTRSYLEMHGFIGEAAELRLDLDIEHENIGDLHIWLVNPAGLRIPVTWADQTDKYGRRISEYRGADLNATFTSSQAQGTNIDSPEIAFNKKHSVEENHVPSEPVTAPGLSSFINDNTPIEDGINGSWRLEIEDVQTGQTGVLRSWGLTAVNGDDQEFNAIGGRFVSIARETGMFTEYKVTLADNSSTPNYDFSNMLPTNKVSGGKYFDTNGNGVQDGDEGYGSTAASAFTIYADINQNGVWDESEPFGLTNSEGQYEIDGLSPGEYVIREKQGPGVNQVFPRTVYTDDFQNTKSNQSAQHWYLTEDDSQARLGTIPNDSSQKHLGLFANETVELRLADIAPHKTLTLEFDLYVAGTWDGNHAFQGGETFRVSANGTGDLINTSFSTFQSGVKTWQNPQNPMDVLPGNNKVDHNDATTLLNHLNTIDSTILSTLPDEQSAYLDVTGDGHISPKDLLWVANFLNGSADALADRRGRVAFTQSYGTETGSSQAYLGRGLEFSAWDTAQDKNTLGYDAYGRHEVTEKLVSDAVYHVQVEFDHDFEDLILAFEGAGLNNTGKANFEQWGIDNVRVTTDHHLVTVDGSKDVTDVDFGNTEQSVYTVSGETRQTTVEAWKSVGNIVVFADLNNNGVHDPGEPIDVSDQDDESSEELKSTEGRYELHDLPEGNITIRQILPPGATATIPQDGVYQFYLDANAKDLDQKNFQFGVNGSLEGQVWVDSNGDGIRDPDETSYPEIQVALDLGNDGSLDLITYTIGGKYEFSDVSAIGPHQVIPFLPANWKLSTQSHPIHVPLAHTINHDLGLVPAGDDSVGNGPGESEGEESEDTTAPTATIVGGTIYFDLNNNGTFDADDQVAAGLSDLHIGVGNALQPVFADGKYIATVPRDVERITLESNSYSGTPLKYSLEHNKDQVGMLSGKDFSIQLKESKILAGTVQNESTNPDSGLGGVTVYIDINNNGQLDSGEPFAVSENDGTTTIINSYVVAGSASMIRGITPDGYHPVIGEWPVTGESSFILSYDKIYEIPDGDDEIHIFDGNDTVYGDNIQRTPGGDTPGRYETVGTLNDVYVFEDIQDIGGNGSSAENDDVYEYHDEGNDLVTFEPLSTGVVIDYSPGNNLVTHSDSNNNQRTIQFLSGNSNSLIEFETLVGSSHSDVINTTGIHASHTVIGHLGDDTIKLGPGDDTVKLFSEYTVGDESLISGVRLTSPTDLPQNPSYVESDTISQVNVGALEKDTLDLSDLTTGVAIESDSVGSHLIGAGIRTLNFAVNSVFETVVDTRYQDTIEKLGSGIEVFTHGNHDPGGSQDVFSFIGSVDFQLSEEVAGNISIEPDGNAAANISSSLDASQFATTLDFSFQALDSRFTAKAVNLTIEGRSIDKIVGSQSADNFNFIGEGVFAGTLIGAGGEDTVDYANFDSGVTVDLETGTAAGVTTVSEIENIVGSRFDDTLQGNDQDNQIEGGLGNDSLAGQAGSDTYRFGNTSANQVEVDEIIDESEYAMVDHDVIDLSFSNQPLESDTQNSNKLRHNSERTIVINDGIKVLEEVRLGSGDDKLRTWDPTVTTVWNNLFHTESGLVIRDFGGSDAYTVDPQLTSGYVHIFESGADLKDELDLSLLNAELFVQMDETNMVSFHHGNPVDISIYDLDTGLGHPLLLENLTGSSMDDIVFGNDANNDIDAMGGDDVIYGLRGRDVLRGHAGQDLLIGGAGHDIYEFENGDFDPAKPDWIIESPGFIKPHTGAMTPGGRDMIDISDLDSFTCYAVNLSASAESFNGSDPDCNKAEAGTIVGQTNINSQDLIYITPDAISEERNPTDLRNDLWNQIPNLKLSGEHIEFVLGATQGKNAVIGSPNGTGFLGGQQDDLFIGPLGASHVVATGAGDDQILTGPADASRTLASLGPGAVSLDLSPQMGQAIIFSGSISLQDLSGLKVGVKNLSDGKTELFAFSQSATIPTGATKSVFLSPLISHTVEEALVLLAAAINSEFSNSFDPGQNAEVAGKSIALSGKNSVLVVDPALLGATPIDYAHWLELIRNEDAIGNNLVIAGSGRDVLRGHDGSDFLISEDWLDIGSLNNPSQRIGVMDELYKAHQRWMFDDGSSVQIRLDEAFKAIEKISDVTPDVNGDLIQLDGPLELSSTVGWENGVDAVFYGAGDDLEGVLTSEEDSLKREF